MTNGIETVMQNIPTKKRPEPAEFYQTIKEELIPLLLKLFHKHKGKEYNQTNAINPVVH
jgi:hypothetical protein